MAYDPASFRDRKGRVLSVRGGIFRGLSSEALEDWKRLKAAGFFQQMTRTGTIVATREAAPPVLRDVQESGAWKAFLEHEAIPFVSYPYEWTFGMLQDAALLQLDIHLAALAEGWTLKDASAFNFQWRGTRPVFIDLLSLEPYREGTPWAGYLQFCQLFLYPLMLRAYKDIPFHPWMRGAIDGITPEQCANLMSFRDLLRPGVLKHVCLQAKLQDSCSGTRADVRGELKRAGFHKDLIIENLKNLRKLIGDLSWSPKRSEWSGYEGSRSYDKNDHESKMEFVRKIVAEKRRKLVWDIGANRGVFSRLAAEHADCVVAMDADHLVTERLYRELKTESNRTILPLVVNAADASPNQGWRGAERRDLAARGKPELVLCLALIHHMVITHNIPLDEFVAWLSGLGGDLVIEFIEKDDPMVLRLLQNKDDDYSDYERSGFEACLSRFFDVVRREPLTEGRRTLYFARRRS